VKAGLGKAAAHSDVRLQAVAAGPHPHVGEEGQPDARDGPDVGVEVVGVDNREGPVCPQADGDIVAVAIVVAGKSEQPGGDEPDRLRLRGPEAPALAGAVSGERFERRRGGCLGELGDERQDPLRVGASALATTSKTIGARRPSYTAPYASASARACSPAASWSRRIVAMPSCQSGRCRSSSSTSPLNVTTRFYVRECVRATDRRFRCETGRSWMAHIEEAKSTRAPPRGAVVPQNGTWRMLSRLDARNVVELTIAAAQPRCHAHSVAKNAVSHAGRGQPCCRREGPRAPRPGLSRRQRSCRGRRRSPSRSPRRSA
jgi:hypothetical protein